MTAWATTAHSLLSVYERLMDDAAQKRRQNVAGQMSLFDMGLGAASPPA